MNFPNVLANAKINYTPVKALKEVSVLRSLPLGEPQCENEFGAAIFSLPDLRVSQSAHCMPWPEYRLLLISPLCTCLQSSSYWILRVPAHLLWPLASIKLAFYEYEYISCNAPSAQGDDSVTPKSYQLKVWSGGWEKKRWLLSSSHCIKRGEGLPMELAEDKEVWQNSLSWLFDLLISHWERLILSLCQSGATQLENIWALQHFSALLWRDLCNLHFQTLPLL